MRWGADLAVVAVALFHAVAATSHRRGAGGEGGRSCEENARLLCTRLRLSYTGSQLRQVLFNRCAGEVGRPEPAFFGHRFRDAATCRRLSRELVAAFDAAGDGGEEEEEESPYAEWCQMVEAAALGDGAVAAPPRPAGRRAAEEEGEAEDDDEGEEEAEAEDEAVEAAASVETAAVPQRSAQPAVAAAVAPAAQGRLVEHLGGLDRGGAAVAAPAKEEDDPMMDTFGKLRELIRRGQRDPAPPAGVRAGDPGDDSFMRTLRAFQSEVAP